MAYEYFIKVDGTELPCPSSFTWGLQDVSASQSGRTDDAIMHKNRVMNMKSVHFTSETVHLLGNAGGSETNAWKGLVLI